MIKRMIRGIFEVIDVSCGGRYMQSVANMLKLGEIILMVKEEPVWINYVKIIMTTSNRIS